MKRLYFFALVAAGLLGAATAKAEDKIEILGQEYSSDYKSDDGTIEWKSSTNTLYLTNAKLEADESMIESHKGAIYVYTNDSKKLSIVLSGNNSIKSPYAGIHYAPSSGGTCTISAKNSNEIPTLTIESGYGCFDSSNSGQYMFDECGVLKLKGCSLKQISKNGVIEYVEEIKGVDIDIECVRSEDYVIKHTSEPAYKDCAVITEGLTWSNETYRDAEDNPATKLQIRRSANIAIGDLVKIPPTDWKNIEKNDKAKISAGTVSFDMEKKVLTLNNAVLDGALNIYESDVKVVVNGACTIKGIFYVNAPVTVSGTGSLEASTGVILKEPLNIEDLTSLSVKNTAGAALTGSGTESKVVIKNSSVNLDGSTSAVTSLASITLQDCFVLSPENCIIDNNTFKVGSTVQKQVSIYAGKVYGFTITADGQVTKVHSANADEIPFKGYDKDKKSEKGYISVSGKTLTLHRISKDYKVTVTNTSEEGLTIVSDGESNIQRIVAQINTTIGSGSRLMIEGSNANGLIELNEAAPDPDKDKVKGVTLRFNEANVELKYTGSNRAIYAHHASSTESKERNKIEIYDSDIKVTTDPEKPVLEGLYLWEMDRASFSKPSGAKFSKDDRSIVDKDGQKAVELVIEGGEDLDISIAGDPINSREADKYGFNEATHTLTLEKAKYKGGTDPAISSDYDDLTIVVIGDNTLESKSNNVIEVPSNSTLVIKSGAKSGDDMPTLSLSTGGGKNAKGALWINGKGKVTIDGVELEATNDEGAGIASKGAATLTIKGANVTAQGTDGSISGWASLVLEGSSIVEPDGAYFKEGEGIGMDDAEGKFAVTTEKVVIRATADAIEDIIADTDSSDSSARKVLINGSIYILRDGKMFNTMGQELQ